MKITKGGNLTLALLFLSLLGLMASSDILAKVEIPKTKADHLAVAERYERLAADEDAIVKEHTEMKKDYKTNQAVLPKQTREQSLTEMEQHCDAIISEARNLADEYKAIANWHKIRATEVK